MMIKYPIFKTNKKKYQINLQNYKILLIIVQPTYVI